MNQSKSLSKVALQKFKQNKIGLFSFWFVVFCGFIAVFGYLIAPDNSQNANQMHIEIHSKGPGFSVDMLSIPSKEKSSQSFIKRLFFGNTQTNTEIAIKSYHIHQEALEYIGYDDGYPKKINLSLLNNTPKKYIKKKTFYFMIIIQREIIFIY